MSMDVNNARLAAMGQSQSAWQTAQPSKTNSPLPDGDEVNAFREAVDKGENRHTHEPGRQGEGGDKFFSKGSFDEEALPSGAALLDSLFGRITAQTEAAGAASASGAGEASLAETSELVETLVERILVSDPGNGPAEVRISLSDKALPGTEVCLTRALDGQLTVTLTSTDASAFQTLVGAQDILRSTLERQGENVRVEVQQGGTGAEDGDTGRQSRGRRNEQEERQGN